MAGYGLSIAPAGGGYLIAMMAIGTPKREARQGYGLA